MDRDQSISETLWTVILISYIHKTTTHFPHPKTTATMDKTSLTLGEWSIFRGYANFVYCRVTVQGETVKISETFYGQVDRTTRIFFYKRRLIFSSTGHLLFLPIFPVLMSLTCLLFFRWWHSSLVKIHADIRGKNRKKSQSQFSANVTQFGFITTQQYTIFYSKRSGCPVHLLRQKISVLSISYFCPNFQYSTFCLS